MLPHSTTVLGHFLSSIFGAASAFTKPLRAPAKAWLKEVTAVLRVPANAATALIGGPWFDGF